MHLRSNKLLVIFLMVAMGCKRDNIIITPTTPINHDQLRFMKELGLTPWVSDNTNSLTSSKNDFIVLNARCNSGNKMYPGYFRTHVRYDENLNERCTSEGFNQMNTYEGSVCETEGNVYYVFHSYNNIDINGNINRNSNKIGLMRDCNFYGKYIWEKTDTLAKGITPSEINFLKSTTMGKLVVVFQDTLKCLDTSGAMIWKQPTSSLQLSAYRSIVETSSGEILLLGEQQSATTDRDFCVIKFDVNGNILWQKKFGGNYYDEAAQILYRDNQHIYLIGHSNSFNQGGMHDALIIQINADGDLYKQQTYGGPHHDGLQCGALYGDQLVVTGYRDVVGDGREQVFVYLLDLDLNLLQQAEAPFVVNHRPRYCGIVNHTLAICGERFLVGFDLPY